MKSKHLFSFLVLASVVVLSGCVARTYSLTKERVDQDLTTGNRGYIMGKAPAQSEAARKDSRTIRVFEFELGRTYKAKKEYVAPQVMGGNEVAGKESTANVVPEQAPVNNAGSQKYTVGKNDTLQKISKKFYGTTKKWTKIYEANKDVLKGPDKVYPGQELNIPESSPSETKAPELKEPKENLK